MRARCIRLNPDHNCNLLIFSIADLIPHSTNGLSRSSSSSSDLLCSFAAAPSTGRFFSIVFIPTRRQFRSDNLPAVGSSFFEFLSLKSLPLSSCQSNGYSSKELPWLPDIVKDFVLPAGFPGSVSDDYLEYMHVNLNQASTSDWAVGLDYSSGTTAAASAAAIRWVSKDGIGAIGRFFIGGRFGNLFDDDPKQWRMYADFIGSAGSIFDLTTPLYPAYFLPLASLGNLAK
ncbi:unnamed protein product [Lactuca virosa]|uniref:Protein root UVB sensitive/RUS domain-containing protein n=1 Tax=Lactuca virosa TaxID=75947 RepID=A0AAU9NTG4_9ASTR|nr:unnamed protein product [Lactuca virosa]